MENEASDGEMRLVAQPKFQRLVCSWRTCSKIFWLSWHILISCILNHVNLSRLKGIFTPSNYHTEDVTADTQIQGRVNMIQNNSISSDIMMPVFQIDCISSIGNFTVIGLTYRGGIGTTLLLHVTGCANCSKSLVAIGLIIADVKTWLQPTDSHMFQV